MTRPNFLVLGASRCGTTWLHALLDTHPKIFMSKTRKEIHFFNEFYGKGYQWYERFFDEAESDAAWIGESTPIYMFDRIALKRIKKYGEIKKVILILRNPVERTISEYYHQQNIRLYKGSFEEFLRDHALSWQWSKYSQYLSHIIELFGRDSLLVLTTEEATDDLHQVKTKLANFLGLERTLFPDNAGHEVRNAKWIPKRRILYRMARMVARPLRLLGLDHIVILGHKIFPRSFFGTNKASSILFEDVVGYLGAEYLEDIEKLEVTLERSFEHWKKSITSHSDNSE